MADMTALDSPQRPAEGGPAARLVLPDPVIDDDAVLYDGASVYLDPADSMLAKSASATALMYPRGVSSSKITGDGAIKAQLTVGPHVRKNSATSGETVPATLPLGWPLYAKDNQTVSLHNGGGTYPFLGYFGGMTGDSTPLPIVWIGHCPFALHEILIPLVKGHADLTAAATSESFNLYTLPGPARVIDPGSIDTLTLFSGGGTGSFTVAFGISTGPDVDAIGNETDIFTGAAAAPKAMGAGVLGYSGAPLAAGVVITATFATDTTVAAATAGAIVACVRLRPGS